MRAIDACDPAMSGIEARTLRGGQDRAALLRRREEALADARDRIVGGVEDSARDRARERREQSPWATEPRAELEDRGRARQQPPVLEHEDEAVGELRRIERGVARQAGLEGRPAERREAEPPFRRPLALVVEDEAHAAMAEAAAAVVEETRRLVRRRADQAPAFSVASLTTFVRTGG